MDLKELAALLVERDIRFIYGNTNGRFKPYIEVYINDVEYNFVMRDGVLQYSDESCVVWAPVEDAVGLIEYLGEAD